VVACVAGKEPVISPVLGFGTIGPERVAQLSHASASVGFAGRTVVMVTSEPRNLASQCRALRSACGPGPDVRGQIVALARSRPRER